MQQEPPSHNTSTSPSSSIDPPHVQAEQAVGLPIVVEGRPKRISKTPPCGTGGANMNTKLGPRHPMKDMQDLLLIIQDSVNDTIGTLAGGSYSNKDIVAAVILEIHRKSGEWGGHITFQAAADKSYPTVYAEDLKEMEGDMGKVVTVWESVKEKEMKETKILWERAFDQPYDKARGEVVLDLDRVNLVKPPVYWEVSDTDVNTTCPHSPFYQGCMWRQRLKFLRPLMKKSENTVI
nr:hypothetical protein CFP56_19053 [Quercus suber]